MFGHKKRKKSEEAPEAEVVSKRKRDRGESQPPTGRRAEIAKLKRSERVSSVVSQTVLDQVMTEVRECNRFAVHHNGNPYYVCFMVDVLALGGLSRKQRNDDSRGQFIECIANGQVCCIATQVLLDDERLVIVPTEHTVQMLSEFGFMVDADYTCVFVSDDGTVMLPYWKDNCGQHEIAVPFTTLQDMYPSLNEMEYGEDEPMYNNISDYFVELGLSWACDEAADEIEAATSAGEDAGEPETIEETDKDEPIVLNEDVSAQSPAETVMMPKPSVHAEPPAAPQPVQQQSAPAPQQVPAPAPTHQPAPASAPRAQVPQQAPGRQVAADEWYASANDAFSSRDLGITVTTERFDAQFAALAKSCIGFSNTPLQTKGPIAETLDAMRRNANDDLRRVHRANLDRLRLEYINRCNDFLAELTYAYDLNNENEWADGKKDIDRKVTDLEADSAQQVNILRDRIDRDLDRAAKAFGETQARVAESEYRERHAQETARRKANVARDVSIDIESARASMMEELYAKRTEDARITFEAGQAKIIKELVEEYRDHIRDSEDAVFREHDRKMRAWLDENRSTDIMYMNAINEKMRLDNTVARIREQHTQEINELAARAKTDVERLEQQCARQASESERIMAELKERHDIEIERLRAELDAKTARENELVEKVSAAQSEAERMVKEQLSMKDAQIEQLKYERDNDARRFRTALYPIIAVAIVIAMAACFLGIWLGINNGVSIVTSLS